MNWIGIVSLAPCLVAAIVAVEGKTRTVTFSKDDLNKLPKGWKADHTGKDGAGSWKVVADDTAPAKSGYVLAQTGESPGPVFNLCIVEDAPADVDVSVMFKANKGKRDQGGGIMWRYV